MQHDTKELLRRELPPAFVYETTARFQDCDPAGILFFGRFFDLFHDAFAAFMRSHGLSIARLMERGDYLMPLKHAECNFLKPVPCEEQLRVEIAGADLKETSVKIGYRVKKPSGEIAALGETVHTFVDAKSFTKIPIPPDARAALEHIRWSDLKD